MYNLRLLRTCLIFIVLTIVVILLAVRLEKRTDVVSTLDRSVKDEVTSFEQMQYFSLDKGLKALELDASSLTIINNKDLRFSAPDGTLHTSKGEQIDYKADQGRFLDHKRQLFLEGDVAFAHPEGEYFAQQFYYNKDKEFLEGKGEVRARFSDPDTEDIIAVTSNYMSSWLQERRSTFIGDVKGTLFRKRAYEGTFDFSSNRMELNSEQSLVKLSENVSLSRNTYLATARDAEIFLDNFNKKLKYYVLYDDIKVVESIELNDGRVQTRRAYSEKLEGYMSQGKIVLTGAPRVEQGNDTIRGYQIVLRENVELVEVEEAQSNFQLRKR